MMKKAAAILFLLAFVAFWSCEEAPEHVDVPTGTGVVDLRLDSGSALRLETKTDAEDLLDGRQFNNVLVLLVNNSGDVVKNVYKTYPYTNQGGGDLQDTEAANSVTEDTIHIAGLLPGTYQVYAYANIDAAAWQQTGANLISAREKLVTSGSFSTYIDRELLGLTTNGTDVPADPSSSMLLTGHKEISVGLSPATPTIDLIRPVVRFRVIVRNHTPYPLTVNQLRFSAFNPDKAFLLDHLDASGIPSVPDGVKYRSMPAFDPSGIDEDSVAATDTCVVYQRLVYENASPDLYKIFATLTLDRSGESLSIIQKSLGDREFGVIDYSTLIEMANGEQVDVLIMNPQKNPRSARLYYGIGSGYLAWESVGYATYAPLVSRATAIYSEESSFEYSGYNYNNTNGYSAWDGVGDPSTVASFNYSGAKSTHFRSITKSNNLYSIEGLAVNPATETSIDNLTIEQGAINDASKFPTGLDGTKLVRFKQSNGNYLQSDCNWGKTGEQAKYSYIKSVAGGAHQDRQFLLFGKYMSGGLLKRILKHNNKEVPLTYMARNEEINVVLNVYYADQTGEITFSVDNSHWTDANATEAGHTFN